MQTNHNDVYRVLGNGDEKLEQMYKDIGSFIFKETAYMMKDPESLILKLKGIGSWHLRKKRMEIVVNEWTDRSIIVPQEETQSDSSYQEYLEKHHRYINFKERLVEYEKYISVRTEVRKVRHLTQFIIPPKNEEKFKSK